MNIEKNIIEQNQDTAISIDFDFEKETTGNITFFAKGLKFNNNEFVKKNHYANNQRAKRG